jgi:hypothetical protein
MRRITLLGIFIFTFSIVFGCSPNRKNKNTTPEEVKFKKYLLDSRFRSEAAATGDVNSDSRMDVICTKGWWEAPVNPKEADWTFHKVGLGPDCSDMLVYDVDDLNNDNKLDIVVANKKGVFVFKQEVEN